MKIALPTILFAVLLDTPVLADKREDRKARRLIDLNRKPRRLGGSKHKNNENKANGAAQNTPPKVTHFSLGSKNTHTASNNQDYNTNIVGGEQSAVGEFPYYGEYK
jgi:hypothetical protein